MKDIWPSIKEVSDTVDSVVTPELFIEEYNNVYNNNELWNEIDVTDQPLYDFDPNSTLHFQNQSFFQGLSKRRVTIVPLNGLRVMGKLGDSVTTDHISPAGAIGKDLGHCVNIYKIIKCLFVNLIHMVQDVVITK